MGVYSCGQRGSLSAGSLSASIIMSAGTTKQVRSTTTTTTSKHKAGQRGDGKTQTLSSISLTIVFPIFSRECENILNTASSTSIVCLAIASNPLGLLLEGSQGKEATEKRPLAT